jgi:hypothetical protein
MGHSIGDGIIVVALSAAFLGYLYLKHLEKQRRLEVVHAERLVAMDKGIPLPELPIDPPAVTLGKPPDHHVPLILGIVLAAFGGGSMIALGLLSGERNYWSLPLPVALIGVGLMLYYLLSSDRSKEASSTHRGH